MRKIRRFNDAARGSTRVIPNRNMFSAACARIFTQHWLQLRRLFIREWAEPICVIWKFSKSLLNVFSSIAFALLTSWIVNSKKNETSIQPWASQHAVFLHTLMTSWSQTLAQSKSGDGEKNTSFHYLSGEMPRFLIMNPHAHLKFKCRQNFQTEDFIMLILSSILFYSGTVLEKLCLIQIKNWHRHLCSSSLVVF